MIVLRGFAQITRGFEYQTDWFLHTGGGLQPTDGPAVAVGDTSARIYLDSVNINLIGVGHRLVPFHYRILESRFSAMLFCERGYPRNGNPSLTMQCLLLFINRNLSQMST